MKMTEPNVEKVGIIKRIVNLIAKDTKAPNESKKTMVVMRVIVLSIFLYILSPIIIKNLLLSEVGIILYVTMIFALSAILVATYFYKTSIILLCFNTAMILWVASIIRFLGWNVGVQQFFVVLVVITFFSQASQYLLKIAYTIFLCILRVLIFYAFANQTPLLPLTRGENELMQILTSIVIYFCLAIMCYVYGRDNQVMEAKLIQYNKQLEAQANTDTLTGLYNRRKGMDVLEKTLEKLSVAGDSAEALSVCICDIDFFKKVNDTYGHDFGDEVLKTVSATLKESVGERNMAIRWGGEEFLLIFKGMNGENAYPIVEMIRSRIKNKTLMYKDTEVSVTMTFGLAEYGYSESLTELLKNADEKLYQGKESGRNRVIY